jgi:VanZ family protein
MVAKGRKDAYILPENETKAVRIQQPLVLWWLLWLLMASLMVLGSLYPFDFVFTRPASGRFIWSWLEPAGLADRVANVLMFTAPGFATALLPSRRSRLVALCILVIFAIGLQFLQMWLPDRVPSVDDVVLNVTGLFSGMIMGLVLLHQCREHSLPVVRLWRSVGLALWLASLLFPFATWTASSHWERAWISLWQWPDWSHGLMHLSLWATGIAQAQRLRPRLGQRRILAYGFGLLAVSAIMRFRDTSAAEILGAGMLVTLALRYRWPAWAGRWAAWFLLAMVAMAEWQHTGGRPLFSLSLWQFSQIMLYKAVAWSVLLDRPFGRQPGSGRDADLWATAAGLDALQWWHQGNWPETSHLVLLTILWLVGHLGRIAITRPAVR